MAAMLAALLISSGALALQTTRRSSARVVAWQRHAVVARELDRLVGASFASLPSRAGCVTLRSDPPHTRCITVAELSPHVRRVTLVIAPTDRGVAADTVVIDRAIPAHSPLVGP